jgi:transcriptional regulator with XRE-family HTH domain
MADGSCILVESYRGGVSSSTTRLQDGVHTVPCMDRAAVGGQIAALRRARGLTLREAASLTGVTHSYIDAIEKGRPNANITLDTLERIAHGLGGKLGVSLHEPADPLDDLLRDLHAGEREKLAAVARALIAARDDARLEVVIESTVDMMIARTPQAARASG